MLTPTTAPRPPLRRIFLVAAVFALFVGSLAFWALMGSRPVEGGGLALASDSNERFQTVRPFALVDAGGRAVTQDDLLGKPWIATFVFTRCTGPCPRITASVRELQDQLGDLDARFVSFTVDPDYDTPAVLSEYARAIGADPARWWFLTGDHAQLVELSNKTFMVPLAKNEGQPVGESIAHATFLMVVDAQNHVRGYYDALSPQGREQALERLRFVAQEGR